MRVSVVTPLYNGGPWIEETLRSVLAQELRPDEIVVVDDGGDDDGGARAAAFEGVRVLPSRRKKRARHTGLLETRGEYVAFLDQDDVWHASHLRRLVDALEEAPGAPAAYGTWIPFRDGTEPRFDPDRPGRTRTEPWATWPVHCPIATPSSVLFRRGSLEAAGGWAVDAAPDWEVYLRLTDPGTLLHLHAGTCAYRLHAKARSSELRRDGFAYLDSQRRGARASLAERLARDTDASTRASLERRRGILEDLEALMRAAKAGDSGAAAEIARRLESTVEDESDEFVDQIFALLVYLFCPEDDPETYRRLRAELLASLRVLWPEDASRTGKALRWHGRPRAFRWRRLARAAMRGRWDDARELWRRRRGA